LDNKYLLAGECKWTIIENNDRLLYVFKSKAEKLPFAKDMIIVPKQFFTTTTIRKYECCFNTKGYNKADVVVMRVLPYITHHCIDYLQC
jgi:hypothetical protein